VTTDTIIQNYLFHHYYNYVYMNKTIRFKKEKDEDERDNPTGNPSGHFITRFINQRDSSITAATERAGFGGSRNHRWKRSL
jgi:hypothetical protein